jgi:hypothetical protein
MKSNQAVSRRRHDERPDALLSSIRRSATPPVGVHSMRPLRRVISRNGWSQLREKVCTEPLTRGETSIESPIFVFKQFLGVLSKTSFVEDSWSWGCVGILFSTSCATLGHGDREINGLFMTIPWLDPIEE